MINKILKGWLNINKLVKIFIYDWHNCTSTAHVAQRGIFAIGFRIFLFASLLLARSPFPPIPSSKKARTGDKSEWSNQQISALQAPIQSGCFVSNATPGRAATARTSPPFLYSSCPFLPSSRLSTCPAQLFGPFRVRLIQRSSG